MQHLLRRGALPLFSLILLCAVFSRSEQPDIIPVHTPSVLYAGEELVYNVRYGFIDLGQVKILTNERVQGEGYTAYRCKAMIQSYQGVPFVDLSATYESLVDTAGFSRYFLGKNKEDGDWEHSEYFFQYEQDRVVMNTGTGDNGAVRRDTLPLESHYHDGLSLFFYARDQLFSDTTMVIPTLVKEKKATTTIRFTGERTSAETDFIDYPVDVVGFEGMAGFVGVFGLTGEFEGWFSNDEARVPIKANMKVIIGSVTLELVSWNRGSWQPPHGGED